MKRGQIPPQIFLIFELLVVIIIIIYFYKVTHQEAAPPQAVESELTNLAVQTSVFVTNPQLIAKQPQPFTRDIL